LLILAGIWVFQLPAGRQLVLQVTGQPPAASSLATPPPGQSQTIPGGEAQTIAATTSAPADDFTTLATELATDISPPPADPPPADPPPADPPADPIAVAQKWVDRGFADEQAGNLQEAVAAYEQALEITGDRKLATHIQQVKRNFNIEPSAVPEPTIEPESAPAPAPIPEPEPAPVPAKVRVTPRMTQAAVMLHTTGNIAAVLNGATQANTFVIAEPMVVTSITTYHWNNAKGKTPGTISLKHVDGTKYGAWQATGRDGQKGVPNATWSVSPGVVLKPGKYTLLDSDPPTWSQNAGTGGKGMCEIKGLPWRQVGAGR
jgi:hypothetical protein